MMEIYVVVSILYLMFCVGCSKLIGMKGWGLIFSPLYLPVIITCLVCTSVLACVSNEVVDKFRKEK